MSAPRVLLVDDQRDATRLLRSALDALGHGLEVIEAPSGEEALLEAMRQRIDLLVTSSRLPGMSGVELMEKVRLHYPELKSILISGTADDKLHQRVPQAEVEALFSKPIPLADFLDVVERSLGLTRTILPQEDADEFESGYKALTELLASFRHEFGVQAVLMLSERGRVLTRAGGLPDRSMEVSLLSALMAIYNAGQKVSRLIHQEKPDNFHVFPGYEHDIMLISLDSTHALLVAGENLAAHERMLQVVDRLRSLGGEIEQALHPVESTPPISPDEKEETAVTEEGIGREENVTDESTSAELANLLDRNNNVKPEQAESFWMEAVKKGGVVQSDPDALSFEQARRLGLTPDENDD
jgi:CheY-like chemotaxis protein